MFLPLCPVATEELLLCLHVDKSVHTPGHAPIWLLPQQHRACPSFWSRAPSSRGWLQRRCLLPRGSTQSAEGLRHPCTRSQTEVEAQLCRFSTVLDAHLAPGLTRKVCHTVQFHHELIGSAKISECCSTSRHRLLNVFQHLRTHRHLQLLSDFVTHTSCRQGRYQHPFDKEQTLFLSATVFGCVSSGSCQEKNSVPVSARRSPSTPAERDNQETDLVSELHTHGKALVLIVLLEVCTPPSFLRHVGVELHLQCGYMIGQA